MKRKILGILLTALFVVQGVYPGFAQATFAPAAGAGLTIARDIGAGLAIRECWKHKITCALAVGAGIYVAHELKTALGNPAGGSVLNSESSPPPKDILVPGGVPIGTPNGKDETRRNIPGGQKAAEDLYGKLAKGGTPVNRPDYPGQSVSPPGGGFVGLRPGSASSSGVPAVDVNIPGVETKKIHFPE